MTFGDIPSFFTSYNKKGVTAWRQKALHLKAKTLLVLHPKVLVETSIVPSHLIPSSQSKGTRLIYSQELFSWCSELARHEAYSGEVLLQHCETPCLKKCITTHDSHTTSLFLICQAEKQKLITKLASKQLFPQNLHITCQMLSCQNENTTWEENCWSIAGLTLVVLILRKSVPPRHCARAAHLMLSIPASFPGAKELISLTQGAQDDFIQHAQPCLANTLAAMQGAFAECFTQLVGQSSNPSKGQDTKCTGLLYCFVGRYGSYAGHVS